jgi:hypothetical protein
LADLRELAVIGKFPECQMDAAMIGGDGIDNIRKSGSEGEEEREAKQQPIGNAIGRALG